MMQSSLGMKLVAALAASGDIANFVKLANIGDMLTPIELPAYTFILGFVKNYNKVPDAATIEAHTQVELPPPPAEPAAYYHDLVQRRWFERELKREMKAAADFLGVQGKDAMAALSILRSCVGRLVTRQEANQVTDFRGAYDIVVKDYVSKYNGEDCAGVKMGWPTFDEMTGGLAPGNMVSLVGKIARGKTWQLLYACLHGWREQGLCQMFVSMEMPALEIHQRLAAMHTHIPVKKLTSAELSTIYLKKLRTELLEVQGAKAPLWVIDGNFGATIDDIVLLAQQLKPDSIWIDGGYLVKHPTERDRYRRVAENAELMKRELASIAPTIVSWQFAKQSGGKTKNANKNNEKLDLEDIGYSYAIPQVSSIVLGLFEEESVETMQSRVIEILKGRKGEVGRFRTRWDFLKMDFSEVLEEPNGKMNFITAPPPGYVC